MAAAAATATATIGAATGTSPQQQQQQNQQQFSGMAGACALSGELCTEPVVSLKSGHVFEKRLILAHLRATGHTCPVTHQDLHPEDLLPLQSSPLVRPRPPSATSLPALIQLFQDEWDAHTLTTYNLKSTLQATREELADALYQHDAACRVIARLLRERDQAREALLQYQQQQQQVPMSDDTAQQPPTTSAETAPAPVPASAPTASPLTPALASTLRDTAAALTKARKALVKSRVACLPALADIKQYKIITDETLHSASKPGITCIAVPHPSSQPSAAATNSTPLVLTGGVDTNALLYNIQTSQIVAQLRTHRKRITDVAFDPSEQLSDQDALPYRLFTASDEKAVYVWQRQSNNTTQPAKFVVKHKFKGLGNAQTGTVANIDVHPSGSCAVATCASNGATAKEGSAWALLDFASATVVHTAIAEEQRGVANSIKEFTVGALHPDGVLHVVGTADGPLCVYDLTSTERVAVLKDQDVLGAVTSIACSPNGYYVASGDTRGYVSVWDLRKTGTPLVRAALVHPQHPHHADPVTSHCVTFDSSGRYLAAGYGSSVCVFHTKSAWSVIQKWNDHSDSVLGVAWGGGAKQLISVSLDRTLKVRGLVATAEDEAAMMD